MLDRRVQLKEAMNHIEHALHNLSLCPTGTMMVSAAILTGMLFTIKSGIELVGQSWSRRERVAAMSYGICVLSAVWFLGLMLWLI